MQAALSWDLFCVGPFFGSKSLIIKTRQVVRKSLPVFWGTAWLATPHPVPYSADIIIAVSNILNSPYLSKVDQYDNRLHYGHPSEHGNLAGTTFVNSAVGPAGSQSPADPPNPFPDNAVTLLVTNLIANRTLPNPDDEPNALYVVIMPTGVSSASTGFLG
jgi:hypothetical protein